MNKETNTIIKMLKTTGIFFIGTVLSKLMLFFLLPIYTKYIPTADFGYYDLSITYVAIVTSVLFFDIWVSIMRHMYDKADIKWKNKAILSGGTIFIVSSIIYIALTVVLGVIADIQYLLLISLYGLSLNINHMYTFPARGFGKNIEFAVSGIINTLVTIIVNIISIVRFAL
jgi:O-antigen/teichoic acid export membrane protein